MEHFKPLFYLWRWIFSEKQAVTVGQRLENLVLSKIAFVAIAGGSVLALVFLSLLGYIDLNIFCVGCAFFMGLLIAFCWSLTFSYEMQRLARLFGLSGLWICRLLCAVLFFAACYSPLLSPPRFLA